MSLDLIITNDSLIDSLLSTAKSKPRRRTIHRFHKETETMQRMINCGYPDSYVRPHKHENPDKIELFGILKGKVAVVSYNNSGTVNELVVLSSDNVRVVEIPPKVWHNIIFLSYSGAAVYEIIDGEYDPKNHKTFAKWAPEEGTKESRRYLEDLKMKVFGLDINTLWGKNELRRID